MAAATLFKSWPFAIATGVEYLREMQNRFLPIDTAAPRIRFALSLGSNFFMEVAKLRAAKILWARVVKAFGGNDESQKMRIHARTSSWNKTAYDPNVNMLRTTTEAFSGVLGGCDSMHVSPFDEVVRAPTDHARRVARNTHTVLREEAGADTHGRSRRWLLVCREPDRYRCQQELGSVSRRLKNRGACSSRCRRGILRQQWPKPPPGEPRVMPSAGMFS